MSQLKRLAWLGNFANAMNSIRPDITVRQTTFQGGHHQICWNRLNFSCLSVTKINFINGACPLDVYSEEILDCFDYETTTLQSTSERLRYPALCKPKKKKKNGLLNGGQTRTP